VNAFALLAERKIAISTKSFAKAAIASIPFLFIAVQYNFKTQSVFVLLM
jgi:hypothetical protein